MKPLMSFLVFLILAGTCRAQTVEALRDALLKHQRYMRGFSADTKIQWRWKDGALVEDEPTVRMFSAIVAKSVKFFGSKIEISSDRYIVFRGKDSKMMLTRVNEPVHVTVDLAGADMAAELPHVEEALFYRDLNEALSAIPPSFQNVVPAYADPSQKPALPPAPAGCDCVDAIAMKCGTPYNLKNKGMVMPKLLHMVDAEFSEEARTQKFSGDVETGLKVETSGKPSDIWIIRPAGLGLTQKAVEAVRQYRFAPATCHAQPVTVFLTVNVNFQIF